MTATTVRDFHLLLPPGWARIPLDDRVAERVVTMAAVQARGVPPERRDEALRALVRMMTAAARDAEAAGGTDVLLSVAAVNDVPVTASCLVAHLPAGGMSLAALEDQLRDEGGEVSVVEVAGGTAVRRHVRREVPYDRAVARDMAERAGLSDDDVARLRPGTTDQVGYFVPLPGSGDMLVFTFGTAQPELAGALVTLFDAIMATMRWVT